jgi:galactokinase
MEKVLIRAFMDRFGSSPQVYSTAPGRINLIGEHTDYNLGYVLPSAVNLNVSFLVSKREDEVVCIWADNFKQEKRFSLLQDVDARQGGWIDFVKGIFWVLLRKGFSLGGINAYVWGNIPLESGLSSSAAFEVSIVSALDSLFDLNLSPLETAKLSQTAENDYVGVKCGLMDQFISVFGKKDKAVFLDCETLAYQYIPVRFEKEGLGILIFDTKVPRNLASSPYNRRREEASKALEKLLEFGIRSYKTITPSLLDEKKDMLGKTFYKRARHVVTENERVKRAVRALRHDDFNELGQLLFQSHESLRDDYQVSCPELDFLYEYGRSSPSCIGARMTGAGFGGSGIALVNKKEMSIFKKQICIEAQNRGFVTPACYEVETGEGMKVGRPVKIK